MAVASLLEAGFIRLRNDLPVLEEVVLVSDKAGCYQNSMLPIMTPFYCKGQWALHPAVHPFRDTR